MNVGQLSPAELAHHLRTRGLRWVIGSFVVQLRANVPQFPQFLSRFYGENQVLPPPWDEIADFHLTLHPSLGLRRFWRPKVYFRLDGNSFFNPFPLNHAPPLFEWGLNMAIAARCNHYLLLHAAVVERNGCALILPGTPGSGKSTLCAALSLRGFRLLSDEFGLFCPKQRMFIPHPRPIGLKNESIDVIRAFDPRASLGQEYPNTRKGTVSYLQPLANSVRHAHLGATPSWIVFPIFNAHAVTSLEQIPSGEAFLRLAANAFNYETMGGTGFDCVAEIVRRSRVMQLRFNHLEEAVSLLEAWTRPTAAPPEP
ncbi:MAG: HprK-related kinase A [Magnetococcales bacterium]|nr:HprK-related kinase A [Magnetococcales bacterium]MBF0151441.1 HprK-related kinase A [Magnetococcales bacterium]MBF0174377.1 HprK-related kinase A [Magnetococcales bacterium]MBF0348933.1 HprK-related kinase A [Magnetococcales bacterium]MBF0632975.1 HprK-related kinase A [Magnetococcales bacterium]